MESTSEQFLMGLKKTSTLDINFLPRYDLSKSKTFNSMITNKKASNIYCNLFKIKLKSKNLYYQYSINFFPEIDLRNKRAQLKLINQKYQELKEVFGDFLFTGETLFSLNEEMQNTQGDIYECIAKDKVINNDGEKFDVEYSIIIKKTKQVIDLNDISAKENISSKILLELIIKDILKANPYIDFYKNLYCKNNEKKTIVGSNFKVDFYPGYHTSIVNTQNGIYLNVQLKNKILSTISCLDLMQEKATSDNGTISTRQDSLREYFITRTVRATYSKRNYKIDDITFEKNPINTSFNYNGKNISLFNYYQVAHKITIKDKKQPLFIMNKIDEEGKKTSIYLIPELVQLAGIDDEMVKDNNFMKNLAEVTKFKPQGKLN
jgi:hypothetical protein